LLAASMFLQGVGLGLFQVACFDISTAVIPRQDRGVAGSLVMMTRTVGVVTGATVLMLVFQTVRAWNANLGVSDGVAFLTGFHAAFRVATILSFLVAITGWLRGWARGATAPETRA
jgi:MFS family permease